MDEARTRVRMVGILYLVQMAAAVMSYSVILEPILGRQDFLAQLTANATRVTVAMLLDLTCGAAVFGIAVLLFPILKQFSESVALWYAGQRLTELVSFMVAGFLLLTLLTLGQDVANAEAAASEELGSLGRYLRDARGNVQNISLLVYCLGAWSLYGLFYVSRLVPRFIAVWGLVAVTLLFIEIMSSVFNRSAGGIWIMMPLGFNEVFLGVWLIVKGFRPQAETSWAATRG